MSQLQIPTVRCRKCNRLIAWVRTVATGKSLPIDPEENEGGNVYVRYESGSLVASVITASERGKGKRPAGLPFMPHFATCPGIPRPEPKPPKPPKPTLDQPGLF